MPSKIPEHFLAEGRKFDNKEDAQRHEEMIDAYDVFRRARTEYGKKLAGTYKTADGKPFDCRGNYTYWRISERHYDAPVIVPISLVTWFDFEWTEDSDGFSVVSRDLDGRPIVTAVRDLYAVKANAKAALVVVCRERLTEFTETLRRLETEAGL
jgi:hypothetical protein